MLREESVLTAEQANATWREYFVLCKPRVVALMLQTAVVGMLLAVPAREALPVLKMCLACLGIAFASASAAVFNHVFDRHIDTKMYRTQRRPLPTGKIQPKQALLFSLALGVLGLGILFFWVNPLTAGLTFLTMFGYAIFYTAFLKYATPQNIVIGGISGAMPPLLGWASMTGTVEPQALLLVLIVFTWTPPHFWSLAIYRVQEYAKADIPMLPVTHGIAFTKLNILLYTLLLTVVTLLPFIIGMCGSLYFFGALTLNVFFLSYAIRLLFSKSNKIAIKSFRYSIIYLMFLFLFLLGDHYLNVLMPTFFKSYL